MSEKRVRRWALIALVIYGLAVLIVLVAPVSYSQIVTAIGTAVANTFGRHDFGYGWIEFAANIAMFAPLGFILALLLPRWGVVLAITVSVSAEAVQAFIPLREPNLRDILANALGAGLGALLAWLITRRRRSSVSAEPLERARGDVPDL